MAGRLHYWDVTRALLMLLGIPFHVALFYSPATVPVHATETSEVFNFVAALPNAFRMSAFYCVAGYFSGLLLMRRNPLAWWRERLVRLGAPLACGLVLICAPLLYIEALVVSAPSDPFPGAGRLYDLIRPTHYGEWLQHLWFLVPLIWMSSAAAVVAMIVPALARWKLPTGLEAWVSRHIVASTLAAAVAFAAYDLATNWLELHFRVPESPLAQITTFSALVRFLPMFAMGFLLSRSEAILGAFTRPAPLIWVVGLTAILVYAALRSHYDFWKEIVIVRGIASVCMTHVALSAAKAWFDRPSAAVDRIVAASFGIYMVHPLILETLGLLFDRLAAPIALKFFVLSVVVFVLSYCVAQLARLNKWWNLAINGVAPKAGPASVAASARSH